ncbi:MAG: hypothetical protein ABGX44_00100 [Candidatus Poseidoniia archaeon]|jgi:hypothetical protein|nr:MAG: hypothetical protein CXT68_04150 [Euryarchaeota archaeon]
MKKEMYVCELFEMEWICNVPRKTPEEARMDAKNYIAGVMLRNSGILLNPDHFGFQLNPPEINAWKNEAYPTVEVSENIGETYPVQLGEDEDPILWRKGYQKCFEMADVETILDEGIKFGQDGIRGMTAEAKDIDNKGIWTTKFGEMDLLGKMMPVPESFRRGGAKEEILAILPVATAVHKCSSCGTVFSWKQICIFMENCSLIPAQCCNMMLWASNDGFEISLQEWV